jgi:hypothetical protein
MDLGGFVGIALRRERITSAQENRQQTRAEWLAERGMPSNFFSDPACKWKTLKDGEDLMGLGGDSTCLRSL